MLTIFTLKCTLIVEVFRGRITLEKLDLLQR